MRCSCTPRPLPAPHAAPAASGLAGHHKRARRAHPGSLASRQSTAAAARASWPQSQPRRDNMLATLSLKPAAAAPRAARRSVVVQAQAAPRDFQCPLLQEVSSPAPPLCRASQGRNVAVSWPAGTRIAAGSARGGGSRAGPALTLHRRPAHPLNTGRVPGQDQLRAPRPPGVQLLCGLPAQGRPLGRHGQEQGVCLQLQGSIASAGRLCVACLWSSASCRSSTWLSARAAALTGL